MLVEFEEGRQWTEPRPYNTSDPVDTARRVASLVIGRGAHTIREGNTVAVLFEGQAAGAPNPRARVVALYGFMPFIAWEEVAIQLVERNGRSVGPIQKVFAESIDEFLFA